MTEPSRIGLTLTRRPAVACPALPRFARAPLQGPSATVGNMTDDQFRRLMFHVHAIIVLLVAIVGILIAFAWTYL